ncbi:MAG: hypothetical protein KDD36_09960 [Flavobacteriales bacterium]|nr:hypothetical protein [Flavobacteriales bacterium]
MVENAIENIEEIVKIQRKSIQTRIYYALILFFTGALLLVVVQVTDIFDDGPYLKEAMSVISGLLSSFSAFPIKELIDKMGSIRIFMLFKLQLQNLGSRMAGNPADAQLQEEADQIIGIVWEKTKKIALT